MGTIVKKVGSAGAGRDYSTIAAFSAGIPADLVADGNSYVCELYNDSLFTASSNTQAITGHTTDATHFVTMRPAAGHGFKDNANASTHALKFNQSNGVAVQGTGGFIFAFSTDLADILIDGVQFQMTGTGNTGVACGNTSTSNCIYQNNIIESADSAMTLNRGYAYNNVIILTGTGGYGIQCAPNSKVIGNTIVRPSNITAANTGIEAIFNGGAIYNNALFGFTNAGTGWASGSYSNNATDAASLPAGTGLTSQTYANQFVTTTASGRDFRTKSGANLIDAGATQGLTTDIIGTARPSGTSYDIGAWEYVAAGGGTAYTLGAARGAFSETGKPATPIYGRKMAAAQAGFSENGQATILKCGRRLAGAQASFAETGFTATLGLLKLLTAARASFALAGKTVAFKSAGRILAAPASIMWTGYAAKFAGAGQVWTSVTPAAGGWAPVNPDGEVWIGRLPGSTTWTLR